MGVSLAMLAILVTSYIAHLIHIMQRVQQNRRDREEKVVQIMIIHPYLHELVIVIQTSPLWHLPPIALVC